MPSSFQSTKQKGNSITPFDRETINFAQKKSIGIMFTILRIKVSISHDKIYANLQKLTKTRINWQKLERSAKTMHFQPFQIQQTMTSIPKVDFWHYNGALTRRTLKRCRNKVIRSFRWVLTISKNSFISSHSNSTLNAIFFFLLLSLWFYRPPKIVGIQKTSAQCTRTT